MLKNIARLALALTATDAVQLGPFTPKQAQFAFGLIDSNGDGIITETEMSDYLDFEIYIEKG